MTLCSFAEDMKTVAWDVSSGDALSQAPCTCLCYPNRYPNPSKRCQKLPCTNECPAPSSAWAPTMSLTANYLSRKPVRIRDPDSMDYGFESRPFTLNLSCSHGSLHLNEYFFAGEKRCTNDNSLCRVNKDCVVAGEDQPGECRTNPPMIIPLTVPTQYQVGLHISPVKFGVGNPFLSLSGTMQSLNLALAGLIYVGKPYFNTMLKKEEIVGTINDGGAISSSITSAGLVHSFRIETEVRAVNNPVQIGMRPGDILIAMNDSINSFCFSIPPSGPDYSNICGPSNRHYIDIDEDTTFTITPDILWIEDMDSEDAVALNKIETLQYACADPLNENDCTCNEVCKCGQAVCTCPQPTACDINDMLPGLLLIQLTVQNGVLSLQPPPGRSSVPITFLQNTTDKSIGSCLSSLGAIIYDKLADCFKPCPNQLSCGINSSTLLFSINLNYMKIVLLQKYLTYRPNSNYYGQDSLKIWAIDQGYTDYFYSYERSLTAAAEQTLYIRVVAVNDPPVISFPRYVLRYQGNQRCYVDYMAFRTAINCPYVTVDPKFYNFSSVPPLDGPQKDTALSQPQVPYISISDVDMDGTVYGNMTLIIQIGDPNTGYAGRFTLSEVLQSVQHFQYFNPNENRGYFVLDGRLEDINILMRRLFYDPNPDFQGIAPFYILALDNNNYGECDGTHKCGFSNPCDNGLDAEQHKPSSTGQGKAVIDVIAGGSALCVATSCEACKKAGDCGWCHGTCRGAGKCMIGKGSPRFESCEKNSSIGLGYGECDSAPNDLLGLAGAAAGVFVFFVLGCYFFRRMILRRYGNVSAYFKKISNDIRKFTSRLNLGSTGKNWRSKVSALAFLLPLVFIIEILLSVSNDASCNYRQEFFMDTATNLVLDVDFCKIRFLSPNQFPSPSDNQITAMKLKFAILDDPAILLNAETCQPGGGVSISIQNSRPLNIRYKNYFCNILLLVPEKFIIPSTTIRDVHGFATSIRSGSMDADSQNFALNFGPNTFSIEGLYLNVRLNGVNAKKFKFDVTDGLLFAENLTATYADVTSTNADLAVTSPTQTSLRFWQKDGGKVCLTAANNSLYVDNSCSYQCQFLPVQTIIYTNISVSSLTKANCSLPTVGGIWNDAKDPPICELTCPQLPRPLIPGCVNQACQISETPICLCKPFCDMVSPEKLDYAGVSGVAGKCNLAGQCCRLVCAGFSKADLFPLPNEPRDGLAVAGTAKPWKPDNLQQMWVFSSTAGVISFQVLHPAAAPSNSWKGGKLSPSIDLIPELGTDGKDALDYLFHPGGSNAPKVEIFYILLTGAGTPELNNGHFEWISNIRYLMIDSWLLRVVSFGTLEPKLLTSTGRLSSGFCPNVVTDELTFNTRLIHMYSLISNTLQFYPPGQPSKALPGSSFIAFRPVSGSPKIFFVDPKTGKVYLEAFDPSNYVQLTLITVFGLLFPFLISLATMLIAAKRWNMFLLEQRSDLENEGAVLKDGFISDLDLEKRRDKLQTRKEILQKEIRNRMETSASSDQVRKWREELANIQAKQHALNKTSQERKPINEALKMECVANTGFFNMYEELEGNQGKARDIASEVFLVIREVVVALGPSALPLYGASFIQKALLDTRCEFAPDKCSCYSSPLPIVQIVRSLVMVFWALCGVELCFHYLALRYSIPRKVVRRVFYVLYFLFAGATVFELCIVCVWIALGVLLFSAKMFPYASAMIGLMSVAILQYLQLSNFRNSLMQKLEMRAERLRAARKLSKLIQPEVFKLVVKRRIKEALTEAGCSTPRIVSSVILSLLLLGLLYGFLFIGFNAFSDPTDPAAGLLNSAILAALTIAMLQYGRAVDSAETEDLLQDADNEMGRQIEKALSMMCKRAVQAHKMQREILKLKTSFELEAEDGDSDESGHYAES